MPFPVTASYVDQNGHQLLTSSNVRDVLSVDLLGSTFWSPDASFSGYAANGDRYVMGENQGDRATWAEEAESDHRGPLSRLPQRFFAVLTDAELSVIDAEDLTLVMRFLVSNAQQPARTIDVDEILSDSGPSPRTIRLRLEESAAASVVSVSISGYSAQSFAVVDADEIDVVLPVALDAEPLVDLEWVVTAGVYGTFLEFVADDSSSGLGSALGVGGNFLNRVHWADGRFIVATNNSVRVLDFRADAAWAFTETEVYGYALYAQSGLQYRNKPEYFSAVAAASIAGVSSAKAVACTQLGTTAYYVLGDQNRVVVLAWSSGTTLPTAYTTTIVGTVEDLLVTPQGVLYVLTSPAPMRIYRSESEWQSQAFTGDPYEEVSASAGGVGRLARRAERLYIGAGAGVWSCTDDGNLSSVEFLYGGSGATYELLSDVGAATVDDVEVDPSTGFLGVLHGGVLDVVDVGLNVLSSSYDTTTSDPLLPPSPNSLGSYAYSTPEPG